MRTTKGEPKTGVADLLKAGARCWRSARDTGAPVQQQLHAVLVRRGCGILAPVLDSLLLLCEAALGRSIVVGTAMLSTDERLLIGLVDGTLARRACITCPREAATALDCAICSTRIMIALAIKD